MTTTLLVGYDVSDGGDRTVLIIGKRDSKGVITIINAFQDEDATDMYNKLINWRAKKDGE